ncbi:pathogenesis-related leaf protein 4-like [Pyrus ussuriensis x Pyrus communis]|uniref:Pathogenesis-related leaf protein 4-like n=1 Tax=Pyrus ussuriensis x Pyrus communis TaxID=2448454 RepID=A0A5N5IEH1_9ROSA|nr:pathogenesis-related leaf protein 4-like [Pyrus ussuriensis x Pyrus communis]
MEGLCKNNISLALLLFCLLGLVCAQDSPDDYVKAHNAARVEVGVVLMEWDEGLAESAKNYANKQATGGCELKHSGTGLGENIAVSPDGDLSAAMAVEGWVREKADYDYSTNACAPGKQCGHYTQVVWRDSGLVGCGKAECADGSSYVVCHYDPAGNSAGEKPY